MTIRDLINYKIRVLYYKEFVNYTFCDYNNFVFRLCRNLDDGLIDIDGKYDIDVFNSSIIPAIISKKHFEKIL